MDILLIDELASENCYKKANLITGFNSDESGFSLDMLYARLGISYDKFTRKDLTRLLSDHLIVCPEFGLAVDYSNQGNDVFMYEFKYKHRSSYSSTISPDAGVAVHGEEVKFVFGIPSESYINDLNINYIFTDADRELSHQIITYWTNFAKYDNPNNNDASSNLPTWDTLNPIDFSRSSAKEQMRPQFSFS